MPNPTRARGIEQLTDVTIRAWLRSNNGDALHDGGGLYLRRRESGAYWSLRQVNRLTGTRTWAALFPDVPYPTATLAEARRKAGEARLQDAKAHTDVVRDRQAKLAARKAEAEAAELAAQRRLTVRQLFERWVATELTPRTSADGTRTGRKDAGAYSRAQFERRVFPAIGDRDVLSVSKADLMAILDSAKVEGRMRTANVLLADLKQMFRFALVRDIIERNPLDAVTKRDVGGVETMRDRVLSAAEITALARAVPAARMGKRSAVAVWLILSTGCRVGEAMAARWEHVDQDARTWHLPDTKNERPHTIHLSDFAMRQIEALAAMRVKGPKGDPLPWLFPNRDGDGPVCIKSFGKQLSDRQRPADKRMQHRSKGTSALALPGGKWTAHDLRRTAATVMAELGVSGDVIDECLNHVIESRVRATYIRNRRLAAQAQAFDALGARLLTLTSGSTMSNVVPLRAAA